MTIKPWREVAHPHKDVLEGTFKQSEFAADISQVHAGTAPPEYQDAENFFARTFITEGMQIRQHTRPHRGGVQDVQTKAGVLTAIPPTAC